MIEISESAKEFIKNQAEFNEPTIIIFEREYQSWCGTRKYIGVEVVEKEKIEKYPQFKKVKSNIDDIEIFAEEGILSQISNNIKINVIGYGPFRRLGLAYSS